MKGCAEGSLPPRKPVVGGAMLDSGQLAGSTGPQMICISSPKKALNPACMPVKLLKHAGSCHCAFMLLPLP